MPKIVEYKMVLETMRSQGFLSLYHNGGAFGFPPGAKTQAAGWIGPADATLRVDYARFAQTIAAPYEQNLARLVVRAWREMLADALWLMPLSHWAYELDFAGRAWMPDALREIGIDPASLEARNDAAAIEFAECDAAALEIIVTRLLECLSGSDFAIAFPGQSVLCTLHHHKQLWWTTSDESIARKLRDVASRSG